MNVVQVYRSLDGEQKRILKEKQLTLNRPIDELLALLKPLASCDTVADKARTPLGCTFALLIVAIVVLLIVFANTGWGGAAWIALAVAVALLIAVATLFFWTKNVDLSNNFREFILPVLAVLREDIDSRQPVNMRLDLRSPTAPEKKTSEGKPYKHGAYYKIIDSTYVDPWMTFDAVLTDGSKLHWTITDAIRERKKTKKNPRGKIKTKTKYAKKTTIEVEVGLRNKTYEVAGLADAEVKQGEKRNTVRVTRQHKTASIDPLTPRALIDVVADVYRHAKHVRKEA